MAEEHNEDLGWTASENAPLLPAQNSVKPKAVFREELVYILKAGLPIYGTHCLEYSLIMASVVTVGHLNTTALAAVTLGTMTAEVSGLTIVQGLSSALDTVLPSAWMSQDPTMVGLWTHRMAVVMGIALLPVFVVWLVAAEQILLWLRQDPEIARLAAVYLRWSTFGLPAYAFNCISRRYFQSQGLFTVPTLIIVVIAPVNAFLNWLLVLGPAPIRLGYIGAPIATAGMSSAFIAALRLKLKTASMNMVSILSIAYGIVFLPEWNRLNQKSAWHPICQRSFQNLGILTHLGVAGVVQTASEWWAWELMTLVASQISPLALATQSILVVSATVAWHGPFALSVALSVRIGNLLGEGRGNRARLAVNASIMLGLVLAAFNCGLFLWFRASWAYLFNDDPEVVTLVASIMPLVGMLQFFDATAVVMGGLLRATSRQAIGAFLNVSGYYIIGLPIGIFLAFYPKTMLGLYGPWIGLMISSGYCAFWGTWICRRTNWGQEVVKVRERLANERRFIGTIPPENE
ncbi:mate-domain-containing protein [Mycena galopus ATCC 62051]|nr:mate-domain-containing protein [Mycena galopus ATCC 62051]